MSETERTIIVQTGHDIRNIEENPVSSSNGAPPTRAQLDDQSSHPGGQATPPEPADRTTETLGLGGTTGPTTPRDATTSRSDHPGDFPEPPAANDKEVFKWNEAVLPAENYVALGKKLAEKEDFYRRSAHGGGLLLAPKHSNAPPVALDEPARFMAAILDYVRVSVYNGDVYKGGLIPSGHLRAMPLSELFLSQLRAVDQVVDRAVYLPPDFRPTIPGYNDGGFGQRVLHVGPSLRVARSPDALNRFLDVMPFASPADRANTIAAGLTVLLRNFWPGGKPIVVVTANKSHAGKETLIICIAVGVQCPTTLLGRWETWG